MEDLQSLLERINRDGVEKAEAEAAKITADARAKADALVKSARDEAAKLRADAERDAREYAERATVTLKQAARDTVLEVEAAVTRLLEKLLAENVNKALSDGETAARLVAEAVKDVASGGEVSAPAALAEALKAALAAKGAFTVVLDETLGSGFSVKTDGGRVEHAFTGEVVAGELARRLRPDLAKLLK